MSLNFKTAYISGGMTGYENFNFPMFDSVEEQLVSEDVEVYSPAQHDRETIARIWPGKKPEDFDGYAVGDITRYFDAVSSGGEFTLDNMLAWDFAVIGTAAEAIIMLPGWEKSSGAKAERFVAEMTKTPVWLANETHGWTADGHMQSQWYFTLDNDQKRMIAPTVKQSDEIGDALPPAHDLSGIGATAKQMKTARGLADRLNAERKAMDALVSGETRVTNATTGGQKGTKDVQLSCIPPEGLRELGRVFAMGAAKYDRNNFRKGYAWSLSADALLRHVLEWLDGNDLDEESGLNHLAHAAWHCLNLIQYHQDHPALDDRWTTSKGE